MPHGERFERSCGAAAERGGQTPTSSRTSWPRMDPWEGVRPATRPTHVSRTFGYLDELAVPDYLHISSFNIFSFAYSRMRFCNCLAIFHTWPHQRPHVYEVVCNASPPQRQRYCTLIWHINHTGFESGRHSS